MQFCLPLCLIASYKLIGFQLKGTFYSKLLYAFMDCKLNSMYI